MSDLPEPRIGDVDRDRVSQQLRVAYGEGRITEGELEDRLAAVYEARTASELNVVIADLPAHSLEVALPQPSIGVVKRSVDFSAAGPWLLAPVVCTLIYFMTNPGDYFWPMWVWLAGGVFATRAVFKADGAEQDEGSPPLPPPAPPEVMP